MKSTDKVARRERKATAVNAEKWALVRKYVKAGLNEEDAIIQARKDLGLDVSRYAL